MSPLLVFATLISLFSLIPSALCQSSHLTRPSTFRYSSHTCIGGRGRFDGYKDRSCRFQNLCYQPSTEEWLYFNNPEATNVILADKGSLLTDSFPERFLNLRSMGIESDAKYWSPVMVQNESIPAQAFVNGNPFSDQLHILYHPHYPSNIGHVVGDDLFPLYNLMQSFGLLTNNAQLLIAKDCARIFEGNPKKIAQCDQFLSMLLPGISRKPHLFATQPDFAERLGVDPQLDLVCFTNLVAGIGPWGFQQSLGKAPSWWGYREFFLRNLGLNPDKTPKKQRITVSIKKGKRALANHDEVVKYLQTTFPDVEVDAIELRSLGGFQQELRYLQDTSVLVTPCGGVSMTAMFLPHNSALIVVDYFNLKVNSSVGMEEKLWSNLGYIRSYHYPFTKHEVELPPGKSDENFMDMRDYGQVRVDLERMGKMVESALKHVQDFMKMGVGHDEEEKSASENSDEKVSERKDVNENENEDRDKETIENENQQTENTTENEKENEKESAPQENAEDVNEHEQKDNEDLNEKNEYDGEVKQLRQENGNEADWS